MATEMPIPQDFGRFVPPMAEGAEEFADVAEVNLFDQDVEELDDGSAIVRLDEDLLGQIIGRSPVSDETES